MGGQKPKCHSKFHGSASEKYPGEYFETVVPLNRRSEIPSAVATNLKRKNSLQLKSNQNPMICRACVQYSQYVSLESPPSKRSHFEDPNETCTTFEKTEDERSNKNTKTEIDVNMIIELIRTGNTDINQQIAEALGESIRDNMKFWAHKKSSEGREILSEISYYDAWENMPNAVLRKFLESLTVNRSNPVEYNERKRIHLVKAVNHLYAAINPKFISTFSFAENLVNYYYSKSKECMDMMGRANSAGCYKTVQNYIEKVQPDPLIFPKEDIFVTFDNNQKLGRNYRIKEGSTMPVSTVTSICVFNHRENKNMQHLPLFKNPCLLPSKSSPDKYNDLYKKYEFYVENVLKKTHRIYRHQFLNDRMKKILNEPDFITADDSSELPQNGCGLSYDRVPSMGITVKANDQECVVVNPNKLETIKTVLDHILEKVEQADPDKKWFFLACDGLPFGSILTLVSSTYVCASCKEEVATAKFNAHYELCTHKTPGAEAEFRLKYQKVIPRPGNGHVEMNLCKAFFSVYFDIFIKPLAKIFNIKSPKALLYFKTCKDYHLTWQILQVLLESVCDELLYQFLLEYRGGSEPSVESFCEWLKLHPNPNVHMASDMLFEFLYPIFLFRAGLRQCNGEVALAGREKAGAIFFGFQHQIYARIMTHDILFLLDHEGDALESLLVQSYRLDGHKHGEGADFLQEWRIKIVKKWLPMVGLPSAKKWLDVTRSLSKLEKIKATTLSHYEIEKQESNQRVIRLEKEIFEARKLIRKSKYFDKRNDTLKSLDGDVISKEFLDIVPFCESNRKKYYKDFLTGQKSAMLNFPVPFTKTTSKTPTLDSVTKKCRKLLKNMEQDMKNSYEAQVSSCTTVEEAMLLFQSIDEEIQEEQDLLAVRAFQNNMDHFY